MQEHDTKELGAISLFSGGGGLDLGFAAAGFSVRVALDNDAHSCRTHELNAGRRDYLDGHEVIEADIQDVSGDDILEKGELKHGEVDLLIGGPPCQAFSVFGRRNGIEDPRGKLVWEFLRLIKELEPKVFLFENVPGLKTIHKGELFEKLLTALSLEGHYNVVEQTYEMAEFGIPQYRKRVFLIGYRGNHTLPRMIPTHGVSDLIEKREPFLTAGDALFGMPLPGPESGIPNHIGRNHSKRIIKRYTELSFGERDSVTRINKLHPERPSFTIIVGSDAGGGKGHVHPFHPREVTPRESARIQTFPDWWEFFGKGRHVIRQVGNAVPPLFAALLGQHLAKHLFAREVEVNYPELIEKLELGFLLRKGGRNDNGSLQSQDSLQQH